MLILSLPEPILITVGSGMLEWWYGGLIQALALGEEWMTNYHKFSVEKDELWKSMGCRSVMSRRQSEPIMVTSSFPVV